MTASGLSTAPVLSTPDDHILQEPIAIQNEAAFPTLSDNELLDTYEIERTVNEIISGGWRRVALQFPDDMLRDAPRVFDNLQQRLGSHAQSARQSTSMTGGGAVTEATSSLETLQFGEHSIQRTASTLPVKLTILADTSYGACCVDEIAAEHVDADVVVHYGRTCLSPTARLPVIYVFTLKPLDLEHVISAFNKAIPERQGPVFLLADIPYQGHVRALEDKLRSVGYTNLFSPSIIHDPTSPIPNRTLPSDAQQDPESLRRYTVFHISDPPQSLLLNIGSRVASILIYSTAQSRPQPALAMEASTAQALRRRYALVTRLSTVPIFGILINTLSVKNYMQVLQHVKDLITSAGKKYYTFVVGKVNAAKVANFSEVGGWVVIGCWESSLIESKDFWKPIITPFELKLALTDEKDRLWTGEWDSNFQALLDDHSRDAARSISHDLNEEHPESSSEMSEQSDDESEPPVFDLRTGRYVSQSRPMAAPRSSRRQQNGSNPSDATKPSTSLIKRGGQDLATIGGQVSPAAQFLRSQRTWRGLGSDADIAYQFDEEGRLQGAQMEEGRSGVARGYYVGENDNRS